MTSDDDFESMQTRFRTYGSDIESLDDPTGEEAQSDAEDHEPASPGVETEDNIPSKLVSVDELDESTDEEIRATKAEIAESRKAKLKIRIPAARKRVRSHSDAGQSTAKLDSESARSPQPKRPRGRPKKAPAPPPSPPPPLTSCPVFLEVTADPLVVKGRNGSIRRQEQAPHLLGPCTLPFTMKWKAFLPFLATAAFADSPECLVIDTMVWRFSANQSTKAGSLPLTTEEGYNYMLSHVRSSALGANGALFIRMAQPTKGEAKLPPWATKPADTSRSTVAVSGDAQWISDSSSKVKESVSIDDKLASIVQELEVEYPEGLCETHPHLRCFHHMRTDWHFELTRPRLLAWANAIRKKTTTLSCPPIGSNFFKANQVISTSKASMSSASSSMAPASQIQPNGPMPLYPSYMPMPGSYAMVPSHLSPAYGMYPAAFPQHLPFHPPSSPILEPCTLQDFCEQAGLGEREQEGLEKLGYQVGDKLEEVDKEDVKGAGFLPCEWQRVVRAEKRFRQKLKKGGAH